MAGAFSQMKSMEFDDEDKLDALQPIAMPDKPDFPYGLRICLTEKEFAKLGLDYAEAEVGAVFHMRAMARITTITCTDGEGGKCCRVEAQIENLEIEDGE
jgi:hypothetical protein